MRHKRPSLQMIVLKITEVITAAANDQSQFLLMNLPVVFTINQLLIFYCDESQFLKANMPKPKTFH